MKKQDKTLHDNDALVKKRKWKNGLGIAAIVLVIGTISVVSIGNYMRTRQKDPDGETDAFNPFGSQGGMSDTVMASGTTSVGIDAVTFEIDFLEDTGLYVEEVYLSNGNSVQAGEKCIKFTQDSIDDARAELEAAALSASLSYRSGVLTDGESRLEAKYTYDMAQLEAQHAKQVYDDTIAQLEADYAQAVKTYEEAQEAYNDYYALVQNNSFYEEYDVANLKKAYEEAYDLYVDRKKYWEVTEDELKSSSTDNMMGGSVTGGNVLSGSVKNDTSVINTLDAEQEAAPSDDSPKEEGGTEESTGEAPDEEKKPDSDKMPGGFGARGNNKEEQMLKNDRKWIVKTTSLLEEEMEEAKENYETALKSYENEINSAELNLQKLLNKLEMAREDYTDADIMYQKGLLSAKTAYETTAAKGTTAQNDYDTQLTSLADSLDRLQDAKEAAEGNLALFEELVGDGYLYTEEAGTVLMITAEEGQTLAGGSMLFAYSNPKELTVSVSVSQSDIARLQVGEEAAVMISEYGSYNGVIETINPQSSSDSRASVAYTVTVRLEGDVSGLDANLTANVVFGVDADAFEKNMFENNTFENNGFENQSFEEMGGRDGRSGKDGKKAPDKAD